MYQAKKVPLSKTQMGIYAECMSFQDSTLYNLPFLGTLGKDICVTRLKKAIKTAWQAHPGLNVRIGSDENGQITQQLSSEGCRIDMIELSDAAFAQQRAHLVRPFDLLGGPLYRFEIYLTPSGNYYFQDIHHIVFDGSSHEIFARDIRCAYDGNTPEKESWSSMDVALEDLRAEKSDAFRSAEAYYAGLLDGRECECLPVRDTFEKVPAQGWLSRQFRLDGDVFRALRKDAGVSTTAFFTSVMGFLIAKYNYRTDSVIATIYNGRLDVRTKNTIGMLVKTLPFVTDIDGNPAIRDLLRKATEDLAMSRQNDLYSFGEIAAEYGVTSAISFAYQGRMLDYRLMDGADMQVERLYDEKHIEMTALLLEISDLGGGNYGLHLGYRTDMFSKRFAENLAGAYIHIARQFLEKQFADEVETADAEAMAQINAFHCTAAPFDTEKTVIDLFREQAVRHPEHTAVVYLDHKYTYKQLDELTDRLAMHLRRCGIGREKVVGVLIPRCEYMVICSLGILKAGGAYLPLDPSYPPERLNLLMQDSAATVLITTPELRSILDGDLHCTRIMTDEILNMEDSGDPLPPPKTEDLFVMLYTSGSTGLPKGVMLEHGNLAAFCAWSKQYYAIDETSVSAVYASYGFDAHMADIYPMLSGGGCVHIIDESIRLDLIQLQKYYNEHGITHSLITTQVGRQFAQLEGTSSLKHLTVGGEKLVPLNPPAYNFYNAYGPTECTIMATIAKVDRKFEDVPIGPALHNLKLYVVDKNGKLLPPGAAGELWISGRQVARCYLNRPEQTAAAFTPNPFCTEEGYTRVYHTGDVVRFMHDGVIQFIGRRDSQVKIRGFRIELTEVEEVIRRFSGIKDATVIAKDAASGGKMLVAYVVSDSPVDIKAMNAFIQQEKPPYMVPAVTMQIDAIPLNANSKVDRRKLPEPVFAESGGETDAGRAQTRLEAEISDVLETVLGHRDFGVETDFAYAGLTSISAIRLAAELNQRFGFSPNVKELQNNANILMVENALVDNWRKASCSQPAEEETVLHSSYPLTQTQLGIYLECMMDAESDMYNIPMLLRLDASIDADRLEQAIHTAVDAHPFLLCRITSNCDGSAVMLPRNAAFWQVARNNCSEAQIQARYSHIVNTISLTDDALFEFEIIRTEQSLYLRMNFHHIIMDGSSVNVLLSDIERAYLGETPEKETYTSFDLALDELKSRSTEVYEKAKAYYASVFDGVQVHSLPAPDVTDLPVGEATLNFPMSELNSEAVDAFCIKHNVTPNVLFTAGFGILLGKLTGQDSAVFASIYNGRTDPRTFRMLGMLVKTYPIYLQLDSKAGVGSFVQAVREKIHQLTANDLYSFAEASRAYGITSDILFAYQGDDFAANTFAGKPAQFLETKLESAKAPLNVDVLRNAAGFTVTIEYRKDMYAPDSIRWMADSYTHILCGLLRAETLGDICPAGNAALACMEEINDTAWPVEYRPACALLEHSALHHPDRLAIVTAEESLSYTQLNALANRLANVLITDGVCPGAIVALMLPRSAKVYITRQGILKAGAAFLPIDPKYPEDRIAYMLQDSGAAALIVDSDSLQEKAAFLSGLHCRVYAVEALLATPNERNPGIERKPDDLCYCIYTSGSTGKPKGVMLSQKNLVNFVDANPKNHEILGYTEKGHVSLAQAAFTFDVSVMEEFIPLANGMTICMAREEEIHNPMALAELMLANHVDMMSCTPSFLSNMIDLHVMRAPLAKVASYDFGAEAFPPSLFGKIRALNPDAYIMNGYGPTEATISCTMDVVTDPRRITIGRPNANVKAYVVDENMHILPPRMRGELVICGDGVGIGYIGREDLTREKFITLNGMRAYRTGDLAEYTHDGLLLFHGRTDNQVKLRGLRVELGEIENAINAYPGVITSIVQVCGEGTHQFLAAWFTASCDIKVSDLQTEIGKTLTHYMVPSVLMQIPAMPLTANGKIDKTKLPEPEYTYADRPYTAPANAVERDLCALFAEILQLERVGAEDHFFELGGTSLSASRIAMFAMEKGYNVVYADIFKHPTPRALAALVLGAQADVPQNKAEIVDYDYSKLEPVLAENILQNLNDIQPGSLGNVLITGTTGFLAIHVLWRYLESCDGTAYCLLRRGKMSSVEKRLRAMLVYYFSDDFEKYFESGRIRCLEGDITNPDTLRQLDALDLRTVINCAALVKHFDAGDALEQVNVQGVKNLIHCCMGKNRRLIQISTVSVAGESVNGMPDTGKQLYENELFFGQLLENDYVCSKFGAERAVLEAVSRGLDAKIMRVGNLMARHTDGEFQINFRSSGFMRQLRGYKMLEAFPMSMMFSPAEFSEIGMTAEAILRLSGTDSKFTVFHPCNNHLVTMADVIYIMQQHGFRIEVVSDAQFQQKLNAAAENPALSDAVGGLIAYMNNDTSVARCMLDASIRFTTEALFRLGFKWPITSPEYLRHMIAALDGLGMF